MAAADLYPFSSEKGLPIPTDIVKPLSMVAFAFAATTEGAIVIPPNFNTCWVYATKACILRHGSNVALPGALVSGTEYANATYIPAGIPTVLQLTEGNGRLLGLADAGILYTMSVQQWAGLLTNNQASFG
jgi:hypothetical protein